MREGQKAMADRRQYILSIYVLDVSLCVLVCVCMCRERENKKKYVKEIARLNERMTERKE